MRMDMTISTDNPSSAAETLLAKIANIEWRQAKRAGDALVPTVSKLMAFISTAPPDEPAFGDFLQASLVVHRGCEDDGDPDPLQDWLLERAMYCLLAEIEDEREQFARMVQFPSETLDVIRRHALDEAGFQLISKQLASTNALDSGDAALIINLVIVKKRIQEIRRIFTAGVTDFYGQLLLDIHEAWRSMKTASEKDGKRRPVHPISVLVRAWQRQAAAKHITQDYERKHPVAVLKHPMGSIREISFVDAEMARLREFATPKNEQLVGFSFPEKPSVLPPVMPLSVAHPMGLKPTTKRGAVSHTVRIFFEALMALEPRERQAEIMFTLGDLIGYLYPDGKFNRTNQLQYIICAIYTLHFYATVPFMEDAEKGTLGYWRPVTARTLLRPFDTDERKIFLDVKLPPDTTQGMAVEKRIMRELGKTSAPKFNAYLTAAWLWDKHGTSPKGLIDPTRPVERRNESGALLDATGNPLRNSRGKTITNLYSPEAVRQLDREPNPEARKRYPVLSDTDLIKTCFPNTTDRNERRLLKLAKAHWMELEQAGIVSIDRAHKGWRLLPGTKHIEAYRGVREAISTKKKASKKK